MVSSQSLIEYSNSAVLDSPLYPNGIFYSFRLQNLYVFKLATQIQLVQHTSLTGGRGCDNNLCELHYE